ncbi:unnamed protein product [Blepharisma stoltei]|uniref:Myb-like DNA-binding domain containing protein n=1 Tax=Blepharisma stoltei TaxID=1481888 RepID=A0AAU9JFP4_9CILI|nr:unnamed protein product [Blepharisma stoltei]
MNIDGKVEQNPQPTPLICHVEGDIFYVPCILSSNSCEFKPLLQPITPPESRTDASKSSGWSINEDIVLYRIVEARGLKAWSAIAKELNAVMHQKNEVRNGRQCRERWYNHVDPSLKKGEWTPEEDMYILEQQQLIGNKWSEIARGLTGRTENSVKNRWKSMVKKTEKICPPGVDVIDMLLAQKQGKEMENSEDETMQSASSMINSMSINNTPIISQMQFSPQVGWSPQVGFSPNIDFGNPGMSPDMESNMKNIFIRELPVGYREGAEMWKQLYFKNNQENISGTPSPSIFLSM